MSLYTWMETEVFMDFPSFLDVVMCFEKTYLPMLACLLLYLQYTWSFETIYCVDKIVGNEK